MINNGVLAVGMVIAGLILILIGANALTDGAAAVAKRFRISNLVIGLTIVAFGTSAGAGRKRCFRPEGKS